MIDPRLAIEKSSEGGPIMKILTASAVALAAIGFAAGAQAQGTKLFFEGDIVRGNQAGAPGPFCVLASQFKRKEKVVWRIRILDQTGKPLDGKGLKTVVVELPDGQKLNARFGPHPPPKQGPATDHFWTAAWIIPESYPSGTFAYKVTATDLQGQTHAWQPFIRAPSQFTVVAGMIEIKKPQPKK
jgi:hypothetical protein